MQKYDDASKTIEEYNSNHSVYGNSNGIANLLKIEKDHISKNNLSEFIYDCAMYAAHSPEEQKEIHALVRTLSKDRIDEYLKIFVLETMPIFFKNYFTNEKLTEIKHKINSLDRITAELIRRQKATPEFWHQANNKMSNSI